MQAALPKGEPTHVLVFRATFIAGNTDYKLQLPADLGTPYEAGVVKEFWVRHHSEKQLVLAQGKQIITLVAQPAY